MNLLSREGSTEAAVTLREFFEKVPPGNVTRVNNCVKRVRSDAGSKPELNLPVLELYCERPSCNGIRCFETRNEVWLEEKQYIRRKNFFVTYRCRNCQLFVKTYAFWAELQEDGTSVDIRKFGEEPTFGPPTPARVSRLLAEEKEYFFKGRRAESQGLGIAAFTYYRRVVENAKNRLIDEIRRVAEKTGAEKGLIDDLNSAREERQFVKAVKAIRHVIPSSLLLDGKHNPLELLHSALSEGLHGKSDEDCLVLATHVRAVLVAFVERAGEVLKDDAELRAAVAKLAKPEKGMKQVDEGSGQSHEGELAGKEVPEG